MEYDPVHPQPFSSVVTGPSSVVPVHDCSPDREIVPVTGIQNVRPDPCSADPPDRNIFDCVPSIELLKNMDQRDRSVLLTTKPQGASFYYRYVMALVPVILVIVCIPARAFLENIFHLTSSSLTSAVPEYMAPFASGIMTQYSAPITDVATITVLMIVPLGVFVFFTAVGWAMRLTELWTGTALTLGLSCVAGIVLVMYGKTSPLSGNSVLLLLQWIAFLVQPFCLVAAGIVLFWTEKFRRSITYTITNEGLWIRGGFPGLQEHMIPHHQIGRIVLEQDYLGAMFNYGTLIPQGMIRWGAETSFQGIGVTGQKDNIGVGIGYAKGREEGSRYPLDCLYGIPDPTKAQKILAGFISRHEAREEEQVSYLKKIYEADVAGAAAGGPGVRQTAVEIAKSPDIQDTMLPAPVERVASDTRTTERRESTIIRITGSEIPPASVVPLYGTMREIPPSVKTADSPAEGTPPAGPVFDQIKKLSELRDKGIITEQEFTAKKTELLKRI